MPTGKERAEKLQADLRQWQLQYYKDAPQPQISRQFKRRIRRMLDKQMQAKLKKEMIKNRRQKKVLEA
jgi:hypothetical protein